MDTQNTSVGNNDNNEHGVDGTPRAAQPTDDTVTEANQQAVPTLAPAETPAETVPAPTVEPDTIPPVEVPTEAIVMAEPPADLPAPAEDAAPAEQSQVPDAEASDSADQQPPATV